MGRDAKDLLDDLIALCHETLGYVKGLDVEDFLESRAIQRATERTLELIGEVANQMGSARPAIDVPWEKILRLRIVLAHAYHKVEPRILYETAIVDVPALLAALQKHQRQGSASRRG